MDTAEEVRMNLASLQRIDPYIISIKESASQVALYRYSATQEWEKTETEGTLFVYERKCEPTYGFLILNRLSTNNWIQPITSEIDSQLQAPFLLYKTKDTEIFGIWFYEKEKCELVSTAIDSLVKDTEKRMNQRNKTLSSSGVVESKKGTDLSSLLCAASNKKTRPNNDSKVMPSLKTTKESPSGGEKLLRLLASGSVGSNDSQPKETQHINTQGVNIMPLNFAQVAAGGRVSGRNGTNNGTELSTESRMPTGYKNVVRSRQDSTNFSDDLYTEEDIKIMAGEKSLPSESKNSTQNPSAGSVANFFAQACQQEQQQQDVGTNQINEQSRPEIRSNESKVQHPIVRTTKAEHVNIMAQHPPGAFVSGGPPGLHFPISTTSGPMAGIVPIIPGGIPGMALLPPQPGVPPIMVPIIPSTQAQLMSQQHQIRLAVAHAQAAAAHSMRHENPPISITNNAQRAGLPNMTDSGQHISGRKFQDIPTAVSPQLPALQTLLSNPAAMSLESLERAHREESRTPPMAPTAHRGPSKNTEMPRIPVKATQATNLESDLRSKLNISQEIIEEKQKGSNGIEGKGKPSYAGAAKSPNKRPQQKGKHQSHELDEKPDKANEMTPSRNQYLKREEIDTEEVQLLSPMVFSTPVNGNFATNANNDTSHLETDNGGITPLTKNQLSQAMQHLLKTDPSFVGKLHVAYVESLNNKLN